MYGLIVDELSRLVGAALEASPQQLLDGTFCQTPEAALASVKGSDWARKCLERWDSLSKPYTGRARRAWEELEE